MREDPIARRNRGGSSVGLWVVAALGALVVLLVVAVMLKPTPAAAPLEAPAEVVSMEQRVAADERAHARRDAARAEAKADRP